jgi:hypothetical protein
VGAGGLVTTGVDGGSEGTGGGELSVGTVSSDVGGRDVGGSDEAVEERSAGTCVLGVLIC